MLATLRSMQNQKWTTLGPKFKADMVWLRQYAAHANGLSIFAPLYDYFVIKCDACLTGTGGKTAAHYFIWEFSDKHMKKYKLIHHLEALNILVTLRTLIPQHSI